MWGVEDSKGQARRKEKPPWMAAAGLDHGPEARSKDAEDWRANPPLPNQPPKSLRGKDLGAFLLPGNGRKIKLQT